MHLNCLQYTILIQSVERKSTEFVIPLTYNEQGQYRFVLFDFLYLFQSNRF